MSKDIVERFKGIQQKLKKSSSGGSLTWKLEREKVVVEMRCVCVKLLTSRAGDRILS